LLVLPIKLAQNFQQYQLIMLLLREAISVLPMVAAAPLANVFPNKI